MKRVIKNLEDALLGIHVKLTWAKVYMASIQTKQVTSLRSKASGQNPVSSHPIYGPIMGSASSTTSNSTLNHWEELHPNILQRDHLILLYNF